MFQIPSEPSHVVSDVIKALNIKDDAKIAAMIKRPGQYLVAPWHFQPSQRLHHETDGWWMLTQNFKRLTSNGKRVYVDDDGKLWYDFPPANYPPWKFIEEWRAQKNKLGTPRQKLLDSLNLKLNEQFPSWVKQYIQVERDAGFTESSKVACSPTSKRLFHSAKKTLMENVSLEDRLAACRKEVKELRKQNQSLRLQVDEKDGIIKDLKVTIDTKDEELKNLQQELEELVESGTICYDDLKPGGRLGKRVKAFTYFETYEQNDLFLEVLNWTDGSDDSNTPGDGMCEHLRRYSNVSHDERSGKTQPDYERKPKKGGRKRLLDWKTEWFVYNVYCHCGWTQNQIAPIFGLASEKAVSDIIHSWANLLNVALKHMFHTPTRSQLLRAYPVRLIRAFGHASIMMLLDCTEVFTQDPDLISAHAAMRSDYKKHETEKFAAGSDAIGCTWGESLPKPYPGAISDPLITELTRIIDQIPFGMAVEVDKGFLIENLCAKLGVRCIRPMKKLKTQTQQSKEDTGLTQKVGNTRIVIEQVNGQASICHWFVPACTRF
jgi:hypothetical protein